MEQYMLKYPNFIFYGPVPLDFADFYTELSNINLKTLSKNKKKIGIIFNLDYSYQSGSHWVSFFLDLENKTLCFFDSTGDKPAKEIRILIDSITSSNLPQHQPCELKPFLHSPSDLHKIISSNRLRICQKLFLIEWQHRIYTADNQEIPQNSSELE